MKDLNWKNEPFVVHDPEAEVSYPPDFLRCEKLIDGQWVNTGWAKNEKAFKRHAEAIGGTVRCEGLYEIAEKVDVTHEEGVNA